MKDVKIPFNVLDLFNGPPANRLLVARDEDRKVIFPLDAQPADCCSGKSTPCPEQGHPTRRAGWWCAKCCKGWPGGGAWSASMDGKGPPLSPLVPLRPQKCRRWIDFFGGCHKERIVPRRE